MIIGAQKCGTTSLFSILNSHPAIVGSEPKELNFFSVSRDWRRDLANYEKHFKIGKNKIYFEASPTYTFLPGGYSQGAWDKKYPIRNFRVWDDIYDYNPDMKLIYLVRHPIDRIISSYVHHYNRGFTNLGIEEAILKDRLFIDVTRYYTQINPYIKKFGRNNVLLIDFDDFVHSRKVVLQKVSDFIGIDFNLFAGYENTHFNASSKKEWRHHKLDRFDLAMRAARKIAPSLYYRFLGKPGISKPRLSLEFQAMIKNMLAVEIKALEILMDKDLSHWILPHCED
jgi:hypothetical protein